MTPSISLLAEASGSAASGPLNSRTNVFTEGSQLLLLLTAPQPYPGVTVHTVVRADPGKFRTVTPHSHDERSYPRVASGRGLPDDDEPAVPGHIDPSVTEKKVIHFSCHLEFVGSHPRSRPDEVRMTMLQAVGITQITYTSTELDHADLPRLARCQALRRHVTIRRAATPCVLPLLAATLNQCGVRHRFRRPGTPDEPDGADTRV